MAKVDTGIVEAMMAFVNLLLIVGSEGERVIEVI